MERQNWVTRGVRLSGVRAPSFGALDVASHSQDVLLYEDQQNHAMNKDSEAVGAGHFSAIFLVSKSAIPCRCAEIIHRAIFMNGYKDSFFGAYKP